MTDKYQNVKNMIAHFDALIADVAANRDKYVGWQSGGFLQGVRNDPVALASFKKVDDWLAKLIKMGRYPERTDEENAQMRSLLEERWDSKSLSRPELLALIRKYPPEILETVLPCVMVMYLLRETDVEFDSDTKTFGDFFDGWHYMVIRA